MKPSPISYLGTTRLWWLVLVVGILLVLGGFAYWFWPAAGYAVASQIFGWLLVLAGIVQLCVAAGPNHAKGWGWWIAGGVIDILLCIIGFFFLEAGWVSDMLMVSFLTSIAFIYWGVTIAIASYEMKPIEGRQ